MSGWIVTPSIVSTAFYYTILFYSILFYTIFIYLTIFVCLSVCLFVWQCSLYWFGPTDELDYSAAMLAMFCSRSHYYSHYYGSSTRWDEGGRKLQKSQIVWLSCANSVLRSPSSCGSLKLCSWAQFLLQQFFSTFCWNFNVFSIVFVVLFLRKIESDDRIWSQIVNS